MMRNAKKSAMGHKRNSEDNGNVRELGGQQKMDKKNGHCNSIEGQKNIVTMYPDITQ
ncbi:hypothetical protein LPTSP4_19690 [Leptospira ryugenii]|uniref:Uncharacterized protein n=1 Tax=Leptospira ryugenii TaxID=1917863 RepID=A0A2P2E0N3_9LEPT|nr:hypothetical protein [Leptospira ryugenii]GBF50444.1 hypothetical protein LPTSP4_19690 [Leptospira ryugenii]